MEEFESGQDRRPQQLNNGLDLDNEEKESLADEADLSSLLKPETPRTAAEETENKHPSLIASENLARILRERARKLPPLHQRVLQLYFFEGLRLKEIAKACNKSEETIATIHGICIYEVHQAMEACAAEEQD